MLIQSTECAGCTGIVEFTAGFTVLAAGLTTLEAAAAAAAAAAAVTPGETEELAFSRLKRGGGGAIGTTMCGEDMPELATLFSRSGGAGGGADVVVSLAPKEKSVAEDLRTACFAVRALPAAFLGGEVRTEAERAETAVEEATGRDEEDVRFRRCSNSS